MDNPVKKTKNINIIKKKKLKTLVVDFIVLILACSAGAFATTAVMIPNGLTSGGITGVVRIIQSFVNINFSIVYYMIAAIVFVLVTVLLGFKEAKK